MWLYNEFIEMSAIRVAIVMRPINERLTGRQLGEISCSTSVCHKGREGRPKVLHMLGVLPICWAAEMVDRHAQTFHHRLQATFRTDTVRLVSACPTLILKEKFCILPVPSMRIDKARRVNHRQFLPSPVLRNDALGPFATAMPAHRRLRKCTQSTEPAPSMPLVWALPRTYSLTLETDSRLVRRRW